VREQIIARQHLENPITIFLPDGSQGRVWLATDKHGSKIIGDELHWRVNVREAIRSPHSGRSKEAGRRTTRLFTVLSGVPAVDEALEALNHQN
jgi:hypothetical protein